MNTQPFYPYPHYGAPCGWQMPYWCPNCQKKLPEPPVPPMPPTPVVPAKIALGGPSECPAVAVIPTIEIPTVDDMKTLYNCFAHVNANNTTYYIDDKHRIILIWAGPVEIDDYDYAENPLKLRSQAVWDFKNNRVVYYNKTGEYKLGTLGDA